ncbi:AAA family ATPase [Spirulina sp. 06S082]|uniref:AAA family ATPase n=1 Tax=Spirulina sp. 06S082 TaxID=3110248 RepID=UPI002B1F13DB|nr:AAA family ATPase [Spirulina sp. 06S082]MEA5470817.1 AAA family ATPase [Spirulina sp. 06S082]
MNTFTKINLNNWRQFDSIDLDLRNQVTVLTGQNGCGKTTILNILNRHFGWDMNLVSTPFINKKTRKKIFSDIFKLFESPESKNSNNVIPIGYIEYSNGVKSNLQTKEIVDARYNLTFQNLQNVIGLHIPSHRPNATYQQVAQIPTNPKTIQQQYQEYQSFLFASYNSNNVRNPGLILKQSLISLALFGYGNQAVVPSQEYLKVFEEFQEILRKIMPESIGFEKIEIRMPDVVLITRSGDFSLDAMSGGINALLGMAWQIHMYGADKEQCTVTIDEPENHLHPSMQRTLLPSLAKAFPKYKFIIATHSPFIVSSMPEANVYGLIYNENNRVESLKIEEADLSGTPNKILREILDVPSNLPVWVEERVRKLLESLDEKTPEERANHLFALLEELGISDQISEFNFH